MKKKLFVFLLVLGLVVGMVACSTIQTFQQKWDALTPDEKARVVINDLQEQLDNAFETGKSYVIAHPEFTETWENDILPAFDVANTTLHGVIVAAQAGSTVTPEQVYDEVQPLVTKVINMLVSMGAMKQNKSIAIIDASASGGSRIFALQTTGGERWIQ
jgi:hypothetical protein